MARNVEIKARLSDFRTQYDLASQICGHGAERIHQVDTFFRCDRGRLKLRVFDDGHGELIFYQRHNQAGPKLSDYILSPTDQPDTLCDALASAYGIDAVIEKERHLFLHGRTRIHLDQVRNLGDFLELEVVLGEDEAPEIGQAEAEALIDALSLDRDSLVDCAYVDLLRTGGHP